MTTKYTLILFYVNSVLFSVLGPVYEISVLIESASSEISGESAHMDRLARAFASHIQRMDEMKDLGKKLDL